MIAARTAQRALAWLALACSIAGYLLISRLSHQPFHLGMRELRFFDLRVYRGAAHRMLDDSAGLYTQPIVLHLGFTYPPAAALALSPLALAPLHVDKIVVTAVNVILLVWLMHSTLRLAGLRRSPATMWSLAALAAAYALWLEPVTVTLGYGQIDLLIAGLVVWDLARAPGSRGRGLAIGVAAGIKLTPLVFLVYLAAAGQRRDAARAFLGFLATIAISWVAATHDTTQYWGSLVLESSRVGGAGDPANQSLRGAIARLLGVANPGPGAEVVIVAVAVVGLILAVRALRRGQPGLGYGLCAVTTLLISPVSWTHHWCLALPGIFLLGTAAIRRRSLGLAAAAVLCAGVGYAYLPELYMGRRRFFISGWPSIGADAYVLLGLAVLAAAAVHDLARRRSGEPTGARELSRPSVPTPRLGSPVHR